MKFPFASKQKSEGVSESPPSTDLSGGSDQEKRRSSSFDERHVPWVTWRSLVLGAFVSIGGIIFGYDTGQISGFLEMNNYKRRFGQLENGKYTFSNVRSGLIVSLLSIGTLIGALLAGPLADRIGRKWSIFVWCIILHVGLIIQISSPFGKWYQMMMGRFVTGFGVGACSLLVPMYQGEIAPRHIRGAMVCSYQLFVTLGIFVAYCINYGTESMDNTASWRIPLGITFLWGLLLGFGILLFPESPRYDYRHGRIDQAKRTMSRLYGIPENHRVIVHEVLEIQDQLDAEKGSRGGWHGWIEMFQAPRMPYRILLGMTLQMFQQLTGANYFFYYGTTVFNGAGISNVFVTQMILGGVNFGTTFGGLYVIEHYGRRKSLIAGGIWMFVCFMIFASVGHFSLDIQTPANTPGAGTAMVVFACLFITGFAMTWGPMVWAIVAELYPSRYRARAMSMATASNWLWNFLLGFFTPFITHDIDFAYGYVFAGCLAIAVVVVYFFVIEGKDRTLEEMDMMYVMRVKPWKSSNWEAPAPEHRLTTAQLMDREVAEGVNRDEETSVGNKQSEGPGHMHAETLEENPAAAAPSAA
ncbi:Major facilitator superfamily domain general substrate transporter [Penicillium atrosanguineum]|uniref:Major facilitator superfamily domain general substrate transporter n=1 Tax=Penicillium atrosanguineum TaxID=1132637 RepID=A0A9W9U6E3_9EURO|nr:Nucleotide-binding alpha-beta plait [Penicillium atrosanguineum]KAJ5122836.1 Major facilitator superfamily domain general substrate transporter [Penicillium atrosanguineum]KAJ5140561.1 Major facilitator superfamily domain general substrate transporter [Penicillium atrosanguineum]KAJ5310474.1 Nucleotide-binding alpha-beta plait [Penicillium atrosanguineum]KAJ5315995.1 Major facilitator superfamily domain general substrate transporter [Penicillium atrosanguineum]